MMSASETRAAEYRAKAEEALARASGSALQQVRERHEAAAATWEGLARFEDLRTFNLSRRFGRAADALAAEALAAEALAAEALAAEALAAEALSTAALSTEVLATEVLAPAAPAGATSTDERT